MVWSYRQCSEIEGAPLCVGIQTLFKKKQTAKQRKKGLWFRSLVGNTRLIIIIVIFFQTQTFEWNLLLPIKRTKSCSKQWFLNLSLHKNPKRSLWIPGHHLTRFLILPISGEGFWGRWPRVHQRSMDHCGLIWSSSHSEGVKQVLRGFKDLMSHDVERPSLYITIFQLSESLGLSLKQCPIKSLILMFYQRSTFF